MVATGGKNSFIRGSDFLSQFHAASSSDDEEIANVFDARLLGI